MKLFLKIIIVLSFVFVACKKDKKVFGVDVQPPNDALDAGFNESSPVYAHTVKYDSILIWNDRYKYLGINKDPYFGTTDVGLYLNANIPDGKTYVSFGEDANAVSSEIILTTYSLGASYVGSSNAIVNYSVFAVKQTLDASKLYYSNRDNFHDPNTILGTFTGSYTSMNGKIVLRIPINKSFANAVLTNPQYLYSNEAFQNTYKGFYIKCSLNNDDGIITRFDLEDDLSGFYLYYQNGSPSATKTDKSFRFVFGGTNPVRFNNVKTDFQGANTSFKQQVLNNDTSKGADNFFLKGLGVSKVKVYIPLLKNLSDSFNVSVNRAELVFKLDPSFSHGIGYAPPARLCLLPIDSLSRENYVVDQVKSVDAQRIGGSYNTETNQYVFNITRHVQAILSGAQKNRGFYLVVGDADNLITYNNIYNGSAKELLLVKRDNYVERVVFAGSNNASLKPVLNLSYIKIKHD